MLTMKSLDYFINERRIITYAELQSIPVVEAGEEMVALPQEVDVSNCLYPFIRSSVCECIARANEVLLQSQGHYQLVVLSAYRPPALQEQMFSEVIEELELKYPNESNAALYERAHHFVAVPNVAAHPTGAAIDVTILCHKTGGLLDMGNTYLDFNPELIPTYSNSINEAQAANRLLLRHAMMSAGFAPYNGEWWHFSYGDREWAAFYGHPNAIYDVTTIA
jgi:zinc D-Ala-D-Ala dipeptidase